MPSTLDRERRWQSILHLLPDTREGRDGMSAVDLVKRLSESDFPADSSEQARLRAVQRDLVEMKQGGLLQIDKSGAKPLRYRRLPQAATQELSTSLVFLKNELANLNLPLDLIEYVLKRMRDPDSFYGLPETQFAVVPDSVRLEPRSKPDRNIEAEIVAALRAERALKVFYTKPGQAERSRMLHPLGVMLRGPRHYLIAFDADDLDVGMTIPKMFLLSRIQDLIISVERSRIPAGFTLKSVLVEKGKIDFARSTGTVKIKLRVWDYARELLQDSLLAGDQRMEADPENSDASIVTASLPLTGTLYRWVLGFGNKMEVIGPAELRRAVAWQANGATEYYMDIYETARGKDNASNESLTKDRVTFAAPEKLT